MPPRSSHLLTSHLIYSTMAECPQAASTKRNGRWPSRRPTNRRANRNRRRAGGRASFSKNRLRRRGTTYARPCEGGDPAQLFALAPYSHFRGNKGVNSYAASAGHRPNQGRTCSNAAAIERMVSSASHGATICRPIGRPSRSNPQGTVAAGRPARLIGQVNGDQQDGG